jgi:hypothetical protein
LKNFIDLSSFEAFHWRHVNSLRQWNFRLEVWWSLFNKLSRGFLNLFLYLILCWRFSRNLHVSFDIEKVFSLWLLILYLCLHIHSQRRLL